MSWCQWKSHCSYPKWTWLDSELPRKSIPGSRCKQSPTLLLTSPNKPLPHAKQREVGIVPENPCFPWMVLQHTVLPAWASLPCLLTLAASVQLLTQVPAHHMAGWTCLQRERRWVWWQQALFNLSIYYCLTKHILHWEQSRSGGKSGFCICMCRRKEFTHPGLLSQKIVWIIQDRVTSTSVDYICIKCHPTQRAILKSLKMYYETLDQYRRV